MAKGFPRGMGGGMGNMNQMIKQAQKMQEQMAKMQEEMETKTFSAEVGGGALFLQQLTERKNFRRLFSRRKL